MASDMLQDFADRLLGSLDRAGITTASKWAEHYRRGRNGEPWQVASYAPWSLEWHDHDTHAKGATQACILKAAQMVATETMVTKCMFANDVLKQDVLYVLPDWRPTASDFSVTRFDIAVKSSKYLDDLYFERNVGLKRTPLAVTYIRGSHGRAGLKSVPAPWLFLDELDEMEAGAIALAYERTSGQHSPHVWELSTPSIDEHGIDKAWKESTQEYFCFPCPLCSKLINLQIQNADAPECLEIVGDDPTSTRVLTESYLKCPECQGKLPHESKHDWLRSAAWIPMVKGREKRGFYINQLYSMTVTPGRIASAWLRGRLSAADEQEFWNSKMGLPHTPKGAKLTPPQVDACRRDYLNGALPKPNKVITMGIDVGRTNHYEIDEWELDPSNSPAGDVNAGARCRVLKAGGVRGFDELDTLMLQYRPDYCVIDAQPERRVSAAFANRFYGRVSMCFYGNGVTGKSLHEHTSDDREPLVTCDRTSWLDESLGRFRKGTITIPRDASFEYVNHLCAIARIWEHDTNGNPVGKYITPSGQADHLAHARNYSEIALALSTNLRNNEDMVSPNSENFGDPDFDQEMGL